NSAVRLMEPFTQAYTYNRYFVTFVKEFPPGLGDSWSANTPVLQNSWARVVSVKHVDAVADPSGLPRAAANTEYALVLQLSVPGHGSGSWNSAAVLSVQLLSITSKAPMARLILQFPYRGTWITLPEPLVVSLTLSPLANPIRFKL